VTTDTIAGKYRIVREIARSNDIVYEAVDVAMGRRLAVKELLVPPNLTGSARQDRVERFNREARAAGKLSHHNIVTVYDFGEDAGRYYIAMEFLEGGTLRDRLQAAGALPAAEAVDIAKQVLSALAHAHLHKVVHRDVKPDNIHILPEGLIKLTDFGIARLTEEASLTGDGQVFGTPSYMSPEQIEGRFIDHRSDLFSAAVVLYEMLSGRKPFTGDSVVSITYAIMNAEPAPLAGASYPLERVVMQGLAKDPAQRFQSAEAMRQALTDAAAAGAWQGDGRTGAPAMFFPPQPAGMSRVPSPWQTASPVPMPSAALPTAHGVPPVYGQPAAAPQQSAGVPMSGPFATWGAPGAPPQSGAPPVAYAPRPVGPLLPEGARTFIGVLAVSFVLAAIILGGVLLFVRSYEEHQRTGATVALRASLADADRRAVTGDLDGAAAVYQRVLTASANSPEGRVARASLAEVWNRQGVRAAQMRDLEQAAHHFEDVLDLYDRYPEGLTSTDAAKQRAAQDNLDAVRSRQSLRGDAGAAGGDEGAARDAPRTRDPGAEAIAAREVNARSLLAAGDAAYSQGDTSGARDLWVRAADAAPGTEPSRTALERLRASAPQPPF